MWVVCVHVFKIIYVKNKYRSTLDTANDVKVKISSIQPDIDSIINNKQQQITH